MDEKIKYNITIKLESEFPDKIIEKMNLSKNISSKYSNKDLNMGIYVMDDINFSEQISIKPLIYASKTNSKLCEGYHIKIDLNDDLEKLTYESLEDIIKSKIFEHVAKSEKKLNSLIA